MFLKKVMAGTLAAAFLAMSAVVYMHYGPVHINSSDLGIIACLVAGMASLFTLAAGTTQYALRERYFPNTQSWGHALLGALPANLAASVIGFGAAEWIHTNVGFGADHIPWTIFVSTGAVGMVAYLGFAHLRR